MSTQNHNNFFPSISQSDEVENGEKPKVNTTVGQLIISTRAQINIEKFMAALGAQKIVVQTHPTSDINKLTIMIGNDGQYYKVHDVLPHDDNKFPDNYIDDPKEESLWRLTYAIRGRVNKRCHPIFIEVEIKTAAELNSKINS